jgi:hypothetical protein
MYGLMPAKSSSSELQNAGHYATALPKAVQDRSWRRRVKDR